MKLAMSIVNFVIYLAFLFGYEFYLTKRRKNKDVFFLASEENWFKVLMVILGTSVVVMDIMFEDVSMFVYAVLFLSYTFTFKEIGVNGIFNNLRRIPLSKITSLEIKEKKHGYHIYYGVNQRTYEMIIRHSLSSGLLEAVEKVQKMIEKNNKTK